MLSIANNAALQAPRALDEHDDLQRASVNSHLPVSPSVDRESLSANVAVSRDLTSTEPTDILNSDRAKIRARRNAAMWLGARLGLATLAGAAVQYSLYRCPGLQDQHAGTPSEKTIFAAAFVGGFVRQAAADMLANVGPQVNSQRPAFSRFHDNASTVKGKIANFILYPPNWYYVGWASLSGMTAGAIAHATNSRTAHEIYKCSLATSWAFEAADGYTTSMYESGRSGATITERPLNQTRFEIPSASAMASTVAHAISRGLSSASTSLLLKHVFKGISESGPAVVGKTSVEGTGAFSGFIRGVNYLFRPQTGEAIKHLVEPAFKRVTEGASAFAKWTGLQRSPLILQMEHFDRTDNAAELAEEGRLPSSAPTARTITAPRETNLPSASTFMNEYAGRSVLTSRVTTTTPPVSPNIEPQQEATGTSIDTGEILPDPEQQKAEASTSAAQPVNVEIINKSRSSSLETQRPLTPGINNRDAEEK